MAKHVYIIAGEASGDFLGAQLMQSLKEKQPDMIFSGIGGALMQRQGLSSLFPMNELSIMGVAEILPKIPHMLKRIKQTVEDIEGKQPDVIITIDAPDFSFRVQKKIKKRGKVQSKQIHYVAPTVWAWRPKRAQKIAQFLDGLICLFPFEPPYFEKEGLKAIAVGHPMMETDIVEAKALNIGQGNTKKLGVFFGSRQGEIKRMSAVLLEAVNKISKTEPSLELIVPTLPHLENKIRDLLKDTNIPYHVLTDSEQKWPTFKSCDTAIAVSGTVGLELAVANIPHLITYKMNPLTFHLLKYILTTKYAHLANIMLQKEVVPEFIQMNCTSNNIANKAIELLSNNDMRAVQQNKFDIVRQELGQNKKSSDIAADFIFSV